MISLMDKILLIDDDPIHFQETKKLIEDKTNKQFLVIPENYAMMQDAFSLDVKDINIWGYIPQLIRQEANEICLIICDIFFKDSDGGLTLIKNIRSDSNYYVYPDHLFNLIVPIIAFTDHPDKEAAAIQIGANYAFHKSKDPRDQTKFIETIRRQISLYKRTYKAWNEFMWPNSIKEEILGFKRENSGINLFIMTSFDNCHKEEINTIKTTLSSKITDLTCHVADDPGGKYSDNILEDVTVFMYGCDLGIAILFKDKDKPNVISPSVCLEIGYMRALQKPVLILTEENIQDIADLNGISQCVFSESNPIQSDEIQKKITKWVIRKLVNANNLQRRD